ncbi:glycosyltransferase family 4 protein [Psychrobacter sp. SHUES1]|uniref:glycosyltransferase family 4 protein n=1 Tax=Psychrobacter sp. SHUES1 TaxID=1849383 RepID=UPI0007F4E682|nr:glycosyltransferase family 4 protein [Psychrobacter sp. SHUES1]OAP71938.1 glycosyl transferase [Psychrobacter sp. SHUES1]
MKFLIFANYLPHVLNFRGQLLKDVANLGYEIHVVAPNLKNHSDEYQHLASLGYQLHNISMQRTGTDPVSDVKTLICSYKLLRQIEPDFILSYTIKPIIYGTLAAWLAKVPSRFVLLSGLGYAFQNSDNNNKPNKLQQVVYSLYKHSLAKSSKVFFQNPDDLNLFKQLKLINNKTSTVVVNGSGVDTNKFSPLPLPQDGSGNTKPSFLLVARLLKDKGIVEYVEAAKIVKQQYPTTEFHLVGWIDENPAAISQAQLDEWIASDVITYWGKLNDVRPAIATCSVYVLPSYREGTSRSVLEAMAMARPIITTDAPGCRETVVDGQNGYLVPVKSIDDLANTMIKFIENNSLYEEMGRASRKMAEEKYDVKKVNAHMIKEMKL